MADNGGGVVTITNRDIYNKLIKVEETVNAMAPQAGRLDDHENRLRTVERWKYALPASIGGTVLSVVLAIVLGGNHG